MGIEFKGSVKPGLTSAASATSTPDTTEEDPGGGASSGGDLGAWAASLALKGIEKVKDGLRAVDALSKKGGVKSAAEVERLRAINLAAAEVWEIYNKEEEKAENDNATGVLGHAVGFVDHLLRDDGKTVHDDRGEKWALERELVAEIKKTIATGEADTLREALNLIRSYGPTHLRGAAREFLEEKTEHGHRKGYPLWELVDFASRPDKDSAPAHDLLERAFELEYDNDAVETPFAVYSLVHAVSTDPAAREKAEKGMKALAGESGFGRAAMKFVFSSSPEGAAVDVGLMFLSAGLGNLAKLSALAKLEKAGVTGYKAVALGKAAEIGAESGALWALNAGREALTHDVSKALDPAHLAKSLAATGLMIGFLKVFGAAGGELAKRLGFVPKVAAEAAKLPFWKKAAGFAIGHGSGLTGMVTSTKAGGALGLHDAPAGGSNESLVHDLFGYVKFALAHKAVDRLLGGKLSEISHRLHVKTAAVEAKIKTRGETVREALKVLRLKSKESKDPGKVKGAFRAAVRSEIEKNGHSDSTETVARLKLLRDLLLRELCGIKLSDADSIHVDDFFAGKVKGPSTETGTGSPKALPPIGKVAEKPKPAVTKGEKPAPKKGAPLGDPDTVIRSVRPSGGSGIPEGVSRRDLVLELASELHDAWRVTRKKPDGSFEPRIKATKDREWIETHEGKTDVDIANTSYPELPSDWRAENRASAEVATDAVLRAAGEEKPLDEAFIEKASAFVHEKWVERNGAWASEELKKPYEELPESEKEKDRVIVRKAIEIYRKEVLTIEVASHAHEMWRETRKKTDGTYEHRIKKTKDEEWVKMRGGVAEVDIANTLFIDLPADWQFENKVSSKIAVEEVFRAIAEGRAIDEAFIEESSDRIHREWVKRNGSWAPEDLKKPYSELPEAEKEKDRFFVRKAIEVFGRRTPSGSEGSNKSGPGGGTGGALAAVGPLMVFGGPESVHHADWISHAVDKVGDLALTSGAHVYDAISTVAGVGSAHGLLAVLAVGAAGLGFRALAKHLRSRSGKTEKGTETFKKEINDLLATSPRVPAKAREAIRNELLTRALESGKVPERDAVIPLILEALGKTEAPKNTMKRYVLEVGDGDIVESRDLEEPALPMAAFVGPEPVLPKVKPSVEGSAFFGHDGSFIAFPGEGRRLEVEWIGGVQLALFAAPGLYGDHGLYTVSKIDPRISGSDPKIEVKVRRSDVGKFSDVPVANAKLAWEGGKRPIEIRDGDVLEFWKDGKLESAYSFRAGEALESGSLVPAKGGASIGDRILVPARLSDATEPATPRIKVSKPYAGEERVPPSFLGTMSAGAMMVFGPGMETLPPAAKIVLAGLGVLMAIGGKPFWERVKGIFKKKAEPAAAFVGPEPVLLKRSPIETVPGWAEDWSDVMPDFGERDFSFPGAREFGGVTRNGDGTYTKRHFLGVIEAEFQALNFIAALRGDNPALRDFSPAVVGRPEPDRIIIAELPGRPLGGLSHETLRAIPPKAWAEFMANLAYLNEKGLYHGDINEGNILWDGKKLRLIDFGRAEVGERKYSAKGLFDDTRRAMILRDSIKGPGFKMHRFPQVEPRVTFTEAAGEKVPVIFEKRGSEEPAAAFVGPRPEIHPKSAPVPESDPLEISPHSGADRFTIGRELGSDFVVTSDLAGPEGYRTVSGTNATFVRYDGEEGWHVVDGVVGTEKRSLNGVFVNGVRIEGKVAPVKGGDLIGIGRGIGTKKFAATFVFRDPEGFLPRAESSKPLSLGPKVARMEADHDGVAAASDPGVGYKEDGHNEDRYEVVSFSDGRSITFVIDGMGGHDGGERAAEIARLMLKRAADAGESMEDAIELAHLLVVEDNGSRPSSRTPGAVVIGVEVTPLADGTHKVRAVSIGDCETLGIDPRDGSYAELFRTAKSFGPGKTLVARTFPFRNHVDQALGLDRELRFDTTDARVPKGTILISGSDGFWENFVTYAEIREIIKESGATGAEAIRKVLMDEALIRMSLLDLRKESGEEPWLLTRERYEEAYKKITGAEPPVWWLARWEKTYEGRDLAENGFVKDPKVKDSKSLRAVVGTFKKDNVTVVVQIVGESVSETPVSSFVGEGAVPSAPRAPEKAPELREHKIGGVTVKMKPIKLTAPAAGGR